MPEYHFACDKCKRVDSVIWPMSRSGELLDCEVCGAKMYRVYNFSVGGDEYSKPIHSDALAIAPSQVAEHRRLFPDIEIDNEHRPVFDHFRKHDDYLEKTGFRKHTKKVHRLGRQTIATMK